MPYDDGVREVFYREDIKNNKIVAGLSYLVFFLPFIARPHSAFCRFHANQSLVILLFFAAGASVRMALIFFPAMGSFLFYAICLVLLLLVAAGMASAFRGRARKLPLIGNIRLLP